MARLARLSIAGQPHHVLLRGVPGVPGFLAPEDFRHFLTCLTQASDRELAIHAYVLMPDQVQLLVTPAAPNALGRAMQSLGRQYVRWFNRRHGRAGALWQGRYRCSVLEPADYLLDASKYIELQPELAGLVTEAESYLWSSLHHHLGHAVDPVIDDHPVVWALGNTPFERQLAYKHLCLQPFDAARFERIKWALARGWVLGSADFLDELSQASERPLEPRKRGRKRANVQAQRAAES
jgi:putative transposase